MGGLGRDGGGGEGLLGVGEGRLVGWDVSLACLHCTCYAPATLHAVLYSPLARLPYTSLGRQTDPYPHPLAGVLRRTFSTYTSPVVSVPERAPVSHMCGASST